MTPFMTTRFGLLVLAALVTAPGAPAAAEDLGPQMRSNRGDTAEESAQKVAREACKVEICDIVETREQHGPDVACDIGWTWHAEEIVAALAGRIDWDWGKAVCRTQVDMKRAPLAKAMRAPRATVKGDLHTIRCTVEQDGKPYIIEVGLAPRVTFKDGRATEAKVNWGDVSAPAAIYPLLYAATGLDNATNVMGPEVVRQINKFLRKDCAAVKDELPGRRVN